MAKNQGKINFGIGFNVDTASLDKVKQTLTELRKMSKADIAAAGGSIAPMSDMKVKNLNHDLGAMRKQIDALGKAYEAAFNPKLGTYELNKFNASLKESGTSAQRAFEAVAAYGAKGEAALLDMTTNMLAFDRAAKEVNSTFSKLGDTMMNTLRWTVTSTAVNAVSSAVQKAYYYSLDLDKSLNNIRIVTDKSAADMEKFAKSANKAAKSLGATTTDYTDASLIYYQQGLSDAEVKARTETTLKVAAVTGQNADAVSEQLTAVWNGYKVSAAESEAYIDKLAAVAATTAADLEELATGMSRVASAANVMGVDIDQLNAQIATIVSVTREAPESVGTALKTVYARMSDIEAGLDAETTMGEYTAQMAEMGVNVLDAKGNLRDMGDVVEEIGNKWTTLNREQQVSLAQSIAGTRQYSRMMALFDNWGMYQESLNTSMTATGRLNEQHLDYLDSIGAHMKELTAASEGLYKSIFEADSIKDVIDALTKIVEYVDHLVQALGGMPGILALAAAAFTKIAKANIADVFSKAQTNRLNQQLNKQQLQHGKAIIAQLQSQVRENDKLNTELEQVLKWEQAIYNSANNLTTDQWQHLQEGVRGYNELVQEGIRLQVELKQAQDAETSAFADGKAITREENGDRKTKTIGKYEYYLADEEDGKNSKGEKRLGLQSARNRQFELKELKAKQKLSNKQKKELDQLNLYIPTAEKENNIRKKRIDTEDTHTKAIEENTKAQKANKEALDSYLNKTEIANFASEVVNGLTSVTFTAIATSSSIMDLTEKVREGNASFEDWLSTISTLTLTWAPQLLSFFTKTIPTLQAVKAGTVTGAAAWTAYWSAATMGISLLITGLTLVLTQIKATDEAQKDALKSALEADKTRKQEIETNLELCESFIKIYEAEKDTKEWSDKLTTAAEALQGKLDNLDVSAYIAAQDFEGLAEAIKQVEHESQNALKSNAASRRNKASSLLTNQDLSDIDGVGGWTGQTWGSFAAGLGGVVSGLGGVVTGILGAGATGGASIAATVAGAGMALSGGHQMGVTISDASKRIHSGDTLDEDEQENIAILKEKLGDKYFGGQTSDGGITLNWPTTGGEMVDLYQRLTEATMDPGWKPDNDLGTNIAKILTDEEFVQGVNEYLGAQKDFNNSFVASRITDSEFSISTDPADLGSFAATRDDLVQQLQAEDPTLTLEEAQNVVDTQLKSLVGGSDKMLTRLNYVSHLTAEGKQFAGQDLMSAVSQMSDADFAALSSLDITQYKTPEELLQAARAQAKYQLNASWAAQGDARLKTSEARMSKLEREEEKAEGLDKIAIIEDQNEVLADQQEILEQNKAIEKQSRDNAAAAFTNLAREKGLEIKNLQTLLENGDYEAIQQAIMGATNLTTDAQAELQNSLIKALEANNAYLETEESIAELTESVAENEEKIAQLRKEALQEQVDLGREASSLRVSQLQREQENAEGLEKIDYIQQTNAELEKQANLQQQLAESAKADRDEAEKEFNALAQTYGLNFDLANGDYDSFISQIKGAGLGDATTNKLLTSLTALYSSSNEYAKNLEEVAALTQETKDNEEEIANLRKEAIERQVDAGLETLSLRQAELDRELAKTTGQEKIALLKEQNKELEKQKELLEITKGERASELAEANNALSTLWQSNGLAQDNLQNLLAAGDYAGLIAFVKSSTTLNESARASLLESLTTANVEYNEYQSILAKILDAEEEMFTTQTEAHTAEIEYLSTLTSKYQNMMNIFKSLSGLYKTIYGDSNFTKAVDLYESQLALQNASLVNVKEALNAELQELTRLRQEAPENHVAIQQREQAALTAYANYLKELGSRLSLFQEMLTNNLNKVFEESVKQFTGKGLEYMSQELKYAQADSKKYLDSQEKEYEIDKLRKDVLADILKMTNRNAQKQMTNLLKEQLAILEETDKLTAKDVTRAQQKIDLLKAEIALENTRNNKHTMQLVRGADGRYSYQYVADQAAIREAERLVEEKRMAVYKSDKEAYEASVSDFNTLYSSFAKEYVGASNPETKSLILNKYAADMQDALMRNQAALTTMQQYGSDYNTSTSMQQWLTGLAGAGGMEALLESLSTEANSTTIADGIDETNNLLTSIKNDIEAIMQQEGVKVPGAASAATGMYTGDWGSSEGRVAILHQKELVLNAHDTENFLQGINVLRSLQLSMLDRVASLNAQSRSPRLDVVGGDNSRPIEQTVHITAEFPNAQDKNEIEQAFTEIVNLAVQHAYRK